MFSWLTKLLGTSYKSEEPKQEPLVLTQEMRIEETPKPKKTTTQKPKTVTQSVKVEVKAPKAPTKPKKVEKVDDGLDSMNKRDLLALAKDKGIKSNASLNKEAIIKAIRNA